MNIAKTLGKGALVVGMLIAPCLMPVSVAIADDPPVGTEEEGVAEVLSDAEQPAGDSSEEPAQAPSAVDASGIVVGTDREAPATCEEIVISTDEEMVEFLNRKYNQGSIKGDYWRYGVKDACVSLTADVTVYSDQVNSQIPENTIYKEYWNSFVLVTSSFDGGGHTVTIAERGGAKAYSLFGDIQASDTASSRVRNLNIVYTGNVYGSTFAQYVHSQPITQENELSNINVTVKGSVLPLAIPAALTGNHYLAPGSTVLANTSTSSDTKTTASGFVHSVDGTNISDVTVSIAGDIGSMQQPTSEKATSAMIHSQAYGFAAGYYYRNDARAVTTHERISINVGGSIIAHSYHTRAEASGYGFDNQFVEHDQININVGGDISALAEGESLYASNYGFQYQPNLATGFSKDVHHLTNSTITVGGSITAVNDTTVDMDTRSHGIGSWSYIHAYNDDPEDVLKQHPLTFHNVQIKVGKDVRAENSREAVYDTQDQQARAIAGFANTLNSGLDNYDSFDSITIDVGGNVGAYAKNGYAITNLWGYYWGDNSSFSADSLVAHSDLGVSYAAPYYHFFDGQGNAVTLRGDDAGDQIISDSPASIAGGVAVYATTYNGEVNSADVSRLKATHPYQVGGFAASAKPHTNHKDISPAITNVHIKFDVFDLGEAGGSAYVGGFVGINEGAINNSSVSTPDLVLNSPGAATDSNYMGGFVALNEGVIRGASAAPASMHAATGESRAYVGGFVGYNYRSDASGYIGTVESSSVCTHTIAVAGADAKTSIHNVGGFVGYDYGTSIADSTAFVRDSLTSKNVGYSSLGGFFGYAYNAQHAGNSAQVGENIESLAGSQYSYVGGYGGYLNGNASTSIGDSTALTFGNITGETTASNVPSLSAAFIARANGAMSADGALLTRLVDSAAYAGGKIVSGNVSGSAADARSELAGGAVGFLSNAEISGFTLLAQESDRENSGDVSVGDNSPTSSIAVENFIAVASDPISVHDNFFVAVDGGSRTAYPVVVSDDGAISRGESLGTVQLASRAFDANYWGAQAQAADVALPLSFNYVQSVSPEQEIFLVGADSAAIFGDDTAAGTLAAFCSRHSAIRGAGVGEGGIATAPYFDILGIPVGQSQPTPGPDPIQPDPIQPTPTQPSVEALGKTGSHVGGFMLAGAVLLLVGLFATRKGRNRTGMFL